MQRTAPAPPPLRPSLISSALRSDLVGRIGRPGGVKARPARLAVGGPSSGGVPAAALVQDRLRPGPLRFIDANADKGSAPTHAFGVDVGVIVIMTRLLKRDRKSTRLNSSHVQISYAVFCLK